MKADRGSSGQRVHELKANPTNVHWGYFSAAIKPVLTIDSGDIVVIEDVPRVDPETVERAGVSPSEIPDNHRAIYREVKERGPGPHVMVGPVSVNGAEPGDTLEVHILDVELAYSYGYNTQRPYRGALPEEFTQYWQRIIRIDREKQTAEVARGVVVPVTRPFFGTMGVAPHPSLGRISTGPPGVHTGNVDNKDLGAGAILYMPVHVRGGLFSAGDGHAAQGHGEMDVTAIETGLRGRFQFFVRRDLKLTWPRGETPTHWIVMGLHEDLNEAMKIAVRETIDFVVGRFPHLTRQEAYMIASVAVDYHVTQGVSERKGIHGMIPKAIFEET
ncbi:MAG: acetamidase/formamidase family protein [Deltaproteobacteria bacterium]|nr:acetamidase/formamidase family protein [Deltaproteobacteria bacterium]